MKRGTLSLFHPWLDLQCLFGHDPAGKLYILLSQANGYFQGAVQAGGGLSEAHDVDLLHSLISDDIFILCQE